MLTPPSICLYVAKHGHAYDGDVVLVEVFFPDSGRCLRLGTLSREGSIGWSVTTLDGIFLLVSIDDDGFHDDTVQAHQIYALDRVKEGRG